MSLTFGFYNSNNHDRTYSAEDMSRIFDGIITDGVYAHIGNKMIAKASPSENEIIVQSGRAWFDHTWTYIDADYPVTVPDAPTVTNSNRIDTLVLDINTQTRANTLVWLSGSATYNGSFNTLTPATLTEEATHHQHPLCYVLRKGKQAKVKAEDILNCIGFKNTVPDYGTKYKGVPFVTGVLEALTIDDMMKQWEAQFDSWTDAQKESFTIWMNERQAEYNNWFDTIKGTLSGDVATGLKNYIESVALTYVGTASGTSYRYQTLKMGGVTVGQTTVPVAYKGKIFGSWIMEKAHTLKSNETTSLTFTNSIFSTDPYVMVDVFTKPGVNYTSMNISGNILTINFPRSNKGTITVRLRISSEE